MPYRPSLTSTSRRDFLLVGARLSAAGAVVLSSGFTYAAATPTTASHGAIVERDLLAALGERIGLEAATMLDTGHTPLHLGFIDAASSDIQALEDGIAHGLGLACCAEVGRTHWDAPAAPILAAAIVSEPASGRKLVVEIERTALSLIGMIEDTRISPIARKQSLWNVPADNLYRIRRVV